MDKTVLNAHLVTTRLKRGFYHLKICGRSDVWKNFGLVANERNDQLDRHVFRGDGFLVVFFRQARDWSRKVRKGHGLGWSAGRVRDRSVQGGSGKDFSSSSRAGLKFANAGRQQTKILIRAGLYCRNTAALENLSAGQWCWKYGSLVNICLVVNTIQLKFQLSSTDIFIIIIP